MTHIWQANPGPQTRFLSTPTYEVLYGGAAGGGKSDALLAGAMRGLTHGSYTGVILRRTYPEFERRLIPRSREIYEPAGGVFNDGKKIWTFATGARILFVHLEHEKSATGHQSAEYQFLGFDELTHFTEKQYLYMLTRVRSAVGLRLQVRCTSNPGGPGHEWVFKKWGPWLDPDFDGPRLSPGEVGYYITKDSKEEWVPKGTLDQYGQPALSRTFIPAKLEDNPPLYKNDPSYRSRMESLDAVTRAQLKDGNWLIKPAAGLYFKRSWFEIVDAAPVDAQRIRYWDRAATEGGGDWTRGVKMARTDAGLYYVENVVSLRGSPARVEATIKQTAEIDGKGVQVGIEQDPAAAGKFEADYYVRALAGWDVRKYPVSKAKITRAQPLSAQSEAGNVKLVRGHWNEEYLVEIEAFPDVQHDDQVDASSGAFSALSGDRYVSCLDDIDMDAHAETQDSYWSD